MEDHLVLESSNCGRQASVREAKSNLKERIVLWVLYQKQNHDEINKVTQIGHVVMPAFAFVVKPFTQYHRGHFETMIIIYQGVLEAT